MWKKIENILKSSKLQIKEKNDRDRQKERTRERRLWKNQDPGDR